MGASQKEIKMKKSYNKKGSKIGKSGINSRASNSYKGLSVYFDEIVRISFKNGLMCFCTPGHNRGAAQRIQSIALNTT